MKKLMPLEEWREKRFTTPPSMQTVRRWANNGDIPGAKKLGGSWFIDIDVEENTTGNDLVDQVLRAS